jgi:Pyruvate/2-oxoacid:ferredoxin oxidoreductase gamma subunit
VYYLSGYSKAFQLHGDGEPTLFYYEDSNIKAVNVVMIGVMAQRTDIDKDIWIRAIEKTVKGKFIDMNKKAFLAGYEHAIG